MPIFPKYQGVSTSIATPAEAKVPLDPFTGQLKQLGEAGVHAGSEMGRVMQKRQALDDEAIAMQQYMKASTDLSDLADTFDKPEIGRTAKDTFAKTVEQKRAEWFKGLSPGAATRLEEHLTPKLLEYRRNASRVENSVRLNDYQAQGELANQRFADSASRITDYRDGKDTDEYRALESYYRVGEKNGYYKPQEVEQALNKALIAGATSRVLKVANSSDKGEILNLLDIYDAENGSRTPKYMAVENPTGLVQKGNINIMQRPRVKNADGSVSTVRSMSFSDDSGKEILVPTVSEDGKIMSEKEAIDQYRKTGRHLGKFDSPEAATAYAEQLHQQQENLPETKKGGTFLKHLDPIKRVQLEETLKNRLEHLNNAEITRKNQEYTDTKRMTADLSESAWTLAEMKMQDPQKYGALTHEWLDLAGETGLITKDHLKTWHDRVNRQQMGGTDTVYDNPTITGRLWTQAQTVSDGPRAKALQAEVMQLVSEGKLAAGPDTNAGKILAHIQPLVNSKEGGPPTPAQQMAEAKSQGLKGLTVTGAFSSDRLKGAEASIQQQMLRDQDINAQKGYPMSPQEVLDKNMPRYKAMLGIPAMEEQRMAQNELGIPQTRDTKASNQHIEAERLKAQQEFQAAPPGPQGDAARDKALARVEKLRQLYLINNAIEEFGAAKNASRNEALGGGGGESKPTQPKKSGGPVQPPKGTFQ